MVSGLAADWNAVRALAPNARVQVATTDKSMVAGTLVRSTADAIVVAAKTGEVSIGQANVLTVKVADPSRRLRNGIVGTAIGGAAGLLIGVAVCPHCSNEGAGGKYTAPGAAIGAAAGATVGFLPPPYRMIYKAPRK